MQAIVETVFDAVYLVSVITIGILMIHGCKGSHQFKLFGLMAVVLGAGDSFHLIPRALALCTTGLENFTVPLGLGKCCLLYTSHIIITTIQKLATFIKKNPGHEVYQKHVVIIFDECHRSQFGDMHKAIVHNFKKYHLFGFTGTPIFAVNAGNSTDPRYFTTAQTFGDQLHTYTCLLYTSCIAIRRQS